MKNFNKYKILSDLAETLDFKETFKINPEISSDEMKSLLKEASLVFADYPSKEKSSETCASHLLIMTDGASRGNPGDAGVGVIIKDAGGCIIKRIGKFIGIATNNAAEYEALILAIESARELGAEKITLYSDSELLVKQIKGEYKVKNEGLKPLYNKAVNILKYFKSYSIMHINREYNKEADKLANQAIDKKG